MHGIQGTRRCFREGLLSASQTNNKEEKETDRCRRGGSLCRWPQKDCVKTTNEVLYQEGF
jgi:hypothetical protein